MLGGAMSQDINTKEIYDCEGCRDWEGKFSRTFNQLLKKDREIAELKDEIRNLILTAEESEQEIASLQNQLTEAQGKPISFTGSGHTGECQEGCQCDVAKMAQGKRGKVVGVEDCKKIVMFIRQNIFLPENDKLEQLRKMIDKAVYGEDK
jgi:predicted RNase H-like nuclease (RuvC/YqgF family)